MPTDVVKVENQDYFKMATYVISYTVYIYINNSNFQCKKDIIVDYMEQCPEEPNMAVSFKDIYVLQINEDQSAFSGKIEFLEPIGEPWKVNIIVVRTVVGVVTGLW
jgi:hypothetical protein